MYFLLFAIALIVLLWLFQVVYLEKFYRAIKANEANKALDSLSELVVEKNENLGSSIDALASEYNIAIAVFDMSYDAVYGATYLFGANLSDLPVNVIGEFVELARENGGRVEVSLEKNTDFIKNLESEYGIMDKMPGMDKNLTQEGDSSQHEEGSGQPTDPRGKINMIKSVLYLQIVNTDSGEYLLVVNSQLSPVDATVNTIRIQLVWISIIMITMALIIATVVSKLVSRSIIRTNDTAKEFGKGNFDVHFDGGDYREIDELSETLNFAASELSKTENLRRELIANVSHDLRTPLTMITAYAEIMRDLPGENTPENVQVVIDEATRLTNLVNDMLDTSKLQAGVMKLEKSIYNLTDSIGAVMGRYNKLKEQDGYTIRFEYKDEVFVEADEFKIYQVIYNLVNNAINYTGEDKTVIVRQKVFAEHVRIEVTDTGEGISKEDIALVWDRYYKVDKTHKRAVMGTGLGLSIVKNILELHGAKYGVDSIPGKGSTFWFALPIAKTPLKILD